MFTRFTVWTHVAALSLVGILVDPSSAQDPNGQPTTPRQTDSRTFQQLFRVGHYFSYTTTNNGFALTQYTAAQKEEIEAQFEEELAVYEKRVKEQDLLEAKRQELMDALSDADAEAQPAIIAEIQAIDGLAGPADRVRRPLGRGQAAIEALRNADGAQRQRILAAMRADFGRRGRVAPSRRPRARMLYRVSEVGVDFLCLVRGNRKLVLPIWSIRSIASEVTAENEAPIPEGATN